MKRNLPSIIWLSYVLNASLYISYVSGLPKHLKGTTKDVVANNRLHTTIQNQDRYSNNRDLQAPSSSSECVDNDAFTFKNGTETCKTLETSPKREKFCAWTSVRLNCQVICNACDDGIHSNCQDDEEFTYKGNKKCITLRTDPKREKLCKKERFKRFCPFTCNTCEAPDENDENEEEEYDGTCSDNDSYTYMKGKFTCATLQTHPKRETHCTWVDVNKNCPYTCRSCPPPPKYCDMCHDGDACNNIECKIKGCEFSCRDVCDFDDSPHCKLFCTPGDDCTKSECSNCRFCKTPPPLTSSSSSEGTCDIVGFTDRTKAAFETYGDYWNQPKHSGYVYSFFIGPLFTDFNGDGVLDYISTMHGHPFEEDKGWDRWELAETTLDDTFLSLKPISERIIITDSTVKEDGQRSIDPHGHNLLDLDGDGLLDILVSSGGAEGEYISEKFTRSRYNFLLWGEESLDESTNETITVFRGGRKVAKAAGVHMRDGRGRINYILDMNGDGKLDIFNLQDRGKTNIISPGIMLMNQGNRTWKEDRGMMEYALSMILTDVDGDGFAQEIMLSRGFCFPQQTVPDGTDPPFSDEVKEFCSTRPVGTTAVYKFDSKSNSMIEISQQYENISADNDKQPPCCPHGSYAGGNDCHARSMASGDFDGDMIADQVVLFQRTMRIYFSTDRAAGELPIGDKYVGVEIKLPKYCDSGSAVHVVDLNNDGDEEILVMCNNPGVFMLYTKGNTKEDWTLDNGCNENGSMGTLVDFAAAGFTADELQEACDTYGNFVDPKWTTMTGQCTNLAKTGRSHKSRKTMGLCLADLNNDGLLDITVVHSIGYLRLLENIPSETHAHNQFIAFKLKGDGSNVNIYGIGSTVILYVENADGEKKTQFREVSSYQNGSDKHSFKDDRIIFGLGTVWSPIEVLVRWPTGVGQAWNLTEWSFSGTMEVIELEYSI